MIQFIEALESTNQSPGNGYYEVYVCEDFVIKKYSDILSFDKDIMLHDILDKHDLIPKKITSFEYEEHFYLVVEKVTCLDEDVSEYKTRRKFDGYSSEYIQWTFDMEKSDEFNNKRKKYISDLAVKTGYLVWDDHSGNFGLNKNGDLVCLDEGSFSLIEEEEEDEYST